MCPVPTNPPGPQAAAARHRLTETPMMRLTSEQENEIRERDANALGSSAPIMDRRALLAELAAVRGELAEAYRVADEQTAFVMAAHERWAQAATALVTARAHVAAAPRLRPCVRSDADVCDSWSDMEPDPKGAWIDRAEALGAFPPSAARDAQGAA
jgi:hypothetical protein